jgi:hypothetical protein
MLPLDVDQRTEYRLWNELQRREERELYEGSLLEFCTRAWREIDPAPFEYNWHMRVVAGQLEALARGETRDLILNLPPRTGKSQASWMSVVRARGLPARPPARAAADGARLACTAAGAARTRCCIRCNKERPGKASRRSVTDRPAA